MEKIATETRVPTATPDDYAAAMMQANREIEQYLEETKAAPIADDEAA